MLHRIPIPVVVVLAITLCLASFAPSATGAETNQPAGKILFLTLVFENDTITLAESAVRPGMLKTPRIPSENKALQYQVLSGTGHLLFKGTIDDPREERIETFDENGQGKIIVREGLKTRAEFMIRTPYHATASTVRFLVKPAPGQAALKSPEPMVIAEIQLPRLAEE